MIKAHRERKSDDATLSVPDWPQQTVTSMYLQMLDVTPNVFYFFGLRDIIIIIIIQCLSCTETI